MGKLTQATISELRAGRSVLFLNRMSNLQLVDALNLELRMKDDVWLVHKKTGDIIQAKFNNYCPVSICCYFDPPTTSKYFRYDTYIIAKSEKMARTNQLIILTLTEAALESKLKIIQQRIAKLKEEANDK